MKDTISRHHHWVYRRAGAQSLVEMALVIPLLILLLTGVFEFGLVLYAHVQVSNAAREGARAASLYRSTRFHYDKNGDAVTCDSIDGWTLARTVSQAIAHRPVDADSGCPDDSKDYDYNALGWLDPNTSPIWTVSINPSLSAGSMPVAGSRVTVTLTYPYHLQIISNVLPILQDPISISKSVEVEYQP